MFVRSTSRSGAPVAHSSMMRHSALALVLLVFFLSAALAPVAASADSADMPRADQAGGIWVPENIPLAGDDLIIKISRKFQRDADLTAPRKERKSGFFDGALTALPRIDGLLPAPLIAGQERFFGHGSGLRLSVSGAAHPRGPPAAAL